MKYISCIFLALLLLLVLPGCEKDFSNPGAATEDQILSSPDGLIGLAVGVQRRYTVGRQSPIYTSITGSGFSTGELRLINPGNISENEVAIGGNELNGDNSIVTQLWAQSLLTRGEAKQVLDNLDVIPNAASRAGLQAYASIFYALSNGNLVNFFIQAPRDNGPEATFNNPSDLLRDNISILENARAALTGTTIPASFLGRIPTGIDLPNTVNALLARYYLQDGQYQQAIDAADRVDLGVCSVFRYDDVTPNPIAFVSITTNNVYQPLDLTLGLPAGLQPDPSDQRLAFYFKDVMPANNNFEAAGFFGANTSAIPIYLPGEILLIKAEAQARLSQVDAAITTLNRVLTKQPSGDACGVGAGLSAYSGAATADAVLAEIYRNRAIEMMMSGQRLADSRRFGRPGPGEANAERNRNYYPFPNSERDNNPNTPPDPPN